MVLCGAKVRLFRLFRYFPQLGKLALMDPWLSDLAARNLQLVKTASDSDGIDKDPSMTPSKYINWLNLVTTA